MNDVTTHAEATVKTELVPTHSVEPGQSLLAPLAGLGSPVVVRQVVEVRPAFGFSQGARFVFETGEPWTTGLPRVPLVVESATG